MQTTREKIRELRALHDDGLLTRQEFDTRRKALLDADYAAPGASASPLRAGTEIGLMAGMEIGPPNRRYQLERLLAIGSMGQVWQAVDLATHAELGHSATVALKVLPPELTRSTVHARLLVEEAAQARQLAHEHIVRVYDWAQDPATSCYFIIMECLEGEDLDALLAREGRLPLARVTELLMPVAEALDYAWHKAHLVHRDIKPGNVFVARGGEVKLLDFGIAARARGNGALEAPGDSGTAGYRAPEAAAQQQARRTLDVHAVAVMVYQLLSGRMPFEPGRLATDVPEMPPGVNARQWDELRRGFAWDAGARQASVHALLAALQAASGPTEEELAAERAQARAAEEARQKELAAKRKAEAVAAAAAQAAADKKRKEEDARARAAEEEARRQRKEELRRQLLLRREQEAAKARREQDEAQRKAAQARAAAAYRAEQQRAREELAARSAAEVEAQMPTDASPTADADGVLRDRFRDGRGHGPELVLVPTGRFQMGSPEHERKRAMEAGAQEGWLARETPQYWVGIEESFALGRYPVTVGQWRDFVRATGWKRHGEIDWEAPGFAQTDAHPVVGVSWEDAQRYVRWLSERTGQHYRLPTEAEWEYACRAGTRSAFSFGETITTDQANYDGNYSYHGSPRGVFRRGTTPVGSFPPNPWGLFDMHGNVWEWVQDVVHENYEGAPLTGRAWEEGGDPSRRVLRGGAWLYNPRYLRSALRNGYAAHLGNDIVGFRIARNLVQENA
ncbi:MAG: bifunctional serine/threonine-protein kinase/formylglycine-generating enzyme family protein [Telluria sp.]